jgi:Cysteine rich repeat
MLIRQLTVASLLSLAVISPGSTQAAKAPLALCKADAERICPGVAPGGGKIVACLKQHKDEVSVGCAKSNEDKNGNVTYHVRFGSKGDICALFVASSLIDLVRLD